MKHWILFLLSACLPIGGMADSYLRVDLYGADGGIVPSIEENGQFEVSKPAWLKEKAPYSAILTLRRKLSADEPTDGEFVLIADRSGVLQVGLTGRWESQPEKRGSIIVTEIRIDGQPFANGNFQKSGIGKDGKAIPVGFRLSGKAEYLPGQGEDGVGAVRVNHDGALWFPLKAEAGKPIRITISGKAAPAL